MPGTIVFKPIEAKLTHNTELITKMDPYCTFTIGENKIKGPVCKKGGKHPHWLDAVTMPVNLESKAVIEVMDKDKISHDDHIGSFVLDLQEVQNKGQVSKWYPIYYKAKEAGEILMETVFQPDSSCIDKANYTEASCTYEQQEQYCSTKPSLIEVEEEVITTTEAPTVFTEQKQVVEPHTFMKEIEVVETRPVRKEIEVMEPVKVVKDVLVTEPVPVKKQIQVAEPQIVKKQVEVMEPRLVTKTIQVVENVPVMKEIEVVEIKTTMQEVETVEPQTITKQIEVTEYVPTKKEVEVTEPVTVLKAVEFVEPVITTQTITKEIQQPIVVDKQITTTVGPATMVEKELKQTTYVAEELGEESIATVETLKEADTCIEKTEDIEKSLL